MSFKGIPSLNIPPIEPLIVDNVVIDHGGSNSRFNLKSSFKNLVISGLTTSNLTKVAANFDKFRIKSESYTERLDLTGNYEMNGQIIFLPITGEGFANISMHQMISVHDVKGDYYVKPEDGETYVNITDYKIKFKPKYVTFAFGNLFNGDKVLGDTMNQFMNQNWKAVFNGLIPEYAKFFGSKFSSIANNVFQNVPIKNIFLD